MSSSFDYRAHARQAIKERREFLDYFYLLSSYDEAERLSAAWALCSFLEASQMAYLGLPSEDRGASELCPDLEYSFQRLIGGLFTNEDAARQGFSVALVELLSQIDQLSLQQFFQMFTKTADDVELQDGRKPSWLFGVVFGMMSLLRCSRLTREAVAASAQLRSLLVEVVRRLLSTAEEKWYVDELCSTLIVRVIFLLVPSAGPTAANGLPSASRSDSKSRLSESQEGAKLATLRDEILPLLYTRFSEDVNDWTPNTLLLALVAETMLGRDASRLLGDCFQAAKWRSHTKPGVALPAIFSPLNFEQLGRILKKSSRVHPAIHSIWPYLLLRLFSKRPPAWHDLYNLVWIGNSSPDEFSSTLLAPFSADVRLESRLLFLQKIFYDVLGATQSTTPQHYLAYSLIERLLPILTPDATTALLTSRFWRPFIDHLQVDPKNSSRLHLKAVALLKAILKTAKKDVTSCFSLFVSLVSSGEGQRAALIPADESGKRTLYNALLRRLDSSSIDTFVASMINQRFFDDSTAIRYSQQALTSTSENARHLRLRKLWVIDQLLQLVRQVELMRQPTVLCSQLPIKIVSFLLYIALFQPASADQRKTKQHKAIASYLPWTGVLQADGPALIPFAPSLFEIFQPQEEIIRTHAWGRLVAIVTDLSFFRATLLKTEQASEVASLQDWNRTLLELYVKFAKVFPLR
ncbi:MAG: hypothetical protein Q8P67_06390, partial [archaeon]|nr:hypothetical protein [archaeon]